MPQKNELVTLDIIDMAHDGNGVGRLDGMAVFVPASAVGDRLCVRIVKVNRTHCYGRIEQILRPSPDRIEPDCPVSRRCGGCVFRHISYEAELRCKQAFVQQNLRRIGKLELAAEPIEPSPVTDGYRNKAQYPVRMQKGGLCAGFFAPRTHEVIDCHTCKLQPPVFGELLEAVLSYMHTYHVSAYDESLGAGLIRHVYLRRGHRSGQIMVCLVVNGTHLPNENALVDLLLSRCGEIVSILLNVNERNTNVIIGEHSRVLYGKPAISDVLCGVRFELSAQSFYQVNHAQAERLYACALEYAALDGAQTVVELYCGAGTITLVMARRAARVIGVEVVPEAVENARENAARNGLDNVEFICADAGQSAGMLAQQGITPDVVVVDPPRKGLDDTAIGAIGLLAAARVVYVSCDPATLARDIKLLEAQGYTASRCRVFDLFPRTAHVETVALLTREK